MNKNGISKTEEIVSTDLNKCDLCKSNTNNNPSVSDEGSVYVCDKCRKLKYVDGLYEFEMFRVIKKARKLVDKKVYLPYAIKSAVGFYPEKEAKRRTRLRERELNGQSNDAYVIARRVSGNFRSAS